MLLACSENKWISTVWRRENIKEENSIVEEAMKTTDDVGVEIQFEYGNIWIDGELVDEGWKPVWMRLKEKLKRGVKDQRVEKY